MSTAPVPLGTLGDLRVPYGVPHGSILAYAQEWVRRIV